jgi:subfamily B ATP-binding cassette protein HlyB/CyaB
VSRDDFIWALGTLCALHRVPFDADLFLRQFPPPYTVEKLLAALGALGFHAGQASTASIGARTTCPCIAFERVESESGEPQPRVAIVAKCDGDQAVVFRSSSRDPVAVSVANLKEAFAPVLVLLRRDPAEPSDPDGAHARPAAFGFGWFVPELLRHKRIWRDVLFASLAIQIAGLGTPLFTQVVIDKVIVHHTQSTLWAVGVALGMFMLFGAVMTWLRQADREGAGPARAGSGD